MSSTTTTASEIAGAQALPLLGLVNYQEGSIVSRVILKREKGNVTIFAFDEGQGLSEHTAPFDAASPRRRCGRGCPGLAHGVGADVWSLGGRAFCPGRPDT